MAEGLPQELRRYLGFTEADEAILKEFLPAARPSFSEIIEHFYDRALQHHDASRVFRSEDQVKRLKGHLREWMERLLAGPWDGDYFEMRSRIGRVHVKVQLPQRYMVTGMSIIHQELCKVAQRIHASDSEKLRQVGDAISRVTHFDLAIMLESYREVTLEKIQRLERMDKEVLAEQLERTEERYLAVIENAEVVIILLDAENRAVFFNRKAEQVTGWQRADSVGRPEFDAVIDRADLVRTRMALESARTGQLPPPPLETRTLTRDGDEHVVRWHFRLQPGSAQSQVLAIGIDVTEERFLQDATRRTERLASLGTLAAGLAHEIRNPLNAAQLQLTLLERRINKQQDVGDGAKLIRDELLRLAHLVQDFLLFARPSKLRLQALDVRDTVNAVLDLCAPEAIERGITLERKGVADSLIAQVDEERIKQVLLNLIRNGMEAVTESHGTVVVTLSRKGRNAVVEVADTGPGVPEGLEVFEPFNSTKLGGTGLGLPIAHRIATEHGGEITLERTDSHTVFRLELPVEGPMNVTT